MTAAQVQNHSHEKIQVARASVFAALLLTAMKLAVGLWTGSLGILSEAAHSGLDLLAAAMTWFSVSVSDRPADATHPYGHSKIDNLSALFETLLLLLTCIWIIYEAVHRLFFASVAVEVNIFSFAVVIIAIIIDYVRGTALSRTAKKTKSAALEADALHFLSDIASSLVVLGGLVLTKLGYAKADALCAVGVAGLVIWISYKLGKKAVDALTDSVPINLVDEVREKALAVAGVGKVYDIRVRHAGPKHFIDLKIGMEHSRSLVAAHELTERVEKALGEAFSGADVIVHPEPDAAAQMGLSETAFVLAQKENINIHDLQIHRTNRGLHLDMHLEWSIDISLGEAHRKATELEERLRDQCPELASVYSHLETNSIESPFTLQDVTAGYPAEAHSIAGEAAKVGGVEGVEQLLITESDNRWHVSLTCLLDPGMPLREAHRAATEVERRISAFSQRICSVLVHTEPVP